MATTRLPDLFFGTLVHHLSPEQPVGTQRGRPRGGDRAGVWVNKGQWSAREEIDRGDLVVVPIPGFGLARVRASGATRIDPRGDSRPNVASSGSVSLLPARRRYQLRAGRPRAQGRKGAATEMMAILRNLVVYLFKGLGHKSAAAATRYATCHPERSQGVLSSQI